jgi:hypothetical protein
VSHLGLRPGTAQDKTCPRSFRASDKAVIRSSVALRAPLLGTTLSENSTGFLTFLRAFQKIEWLPLPTENFQVGYSRSKAPEVLAPSSKPAFRHKRHHASGPRPSKVSPSRADPSATHAVRSGVDEHCVTNVSGARAGLVSDHSGVARGVDTHRLAVPSPLSLPTFFAAAKKVPPHTGAKPNRPLRKQGKANATRTPTKPRRRRQHQQEQKTETACKAKKAHPCNLNFPTITFKALA